MQNAECGAHIQTYSTESLILTWVGTTFWGSGGIVEVWGRVWREAGKITLWEEDTSTLDRIPTCHKASSKLRTMSLGW